MKQPSKEVKFARHCVITILDNGGQPTAEGIKEVFNIRFGGTDVLLEHLKALDEVFQKAIKELEEIHFQWLHGS